MSVLRTIFAVLLLAFVSATAPAQQSGIAIVGADVLPMTGRARLADQTVLVSNGRITAIGPRARTKVPNGYRVIQARGQTLMPGLVDMHIHLVSGEGAAGQAARRTLAVSLAYGITTARTMAGHATHPAVRAAIERGEIVGPRLYAAAPAVHDGNVKTVEQAKAAVAAAKAAGFDLLKSHELSNPALWQAVHDEARRLQLPTGGHVPNVIGLDRAVAMNQQVEHLDATMFALLPAGAPERSIQFGQIPPPEVVKAVAARPEAEFAALSRRLAAARSPQVPTLSLFEKIVAVDVPTETLMRSPGSRFVPNHVLRQWAEQRQGLVSQIKLEDARAFTELRRRIARAHHKAGVPMMPGSDTAQFFHVFGEGLLEEVESFQKAGIPPMDALRAATVVPRDYFRSLPNNGSALGWKADFGTVEPGARADLILLARDPSRDVSALRTLQTVIAAGRVYDRAALDAMIAKASAEAKAVQPPPAPAAAAAASAGAGAAASAAAPAALPRLVYVMRHLERGEGNDPPLTEQGAANARRLADLFAKDPPVAIYVSPTRRARETAAPLAARLRLTPKVYTPGDTAGLVAAVAKEAGPVLIVGHSNTVPDIVAGLGAAKPAPLAETQFGDLWTIDGKTRAVTKSRVN